MKKLYVFAGCILLFITITSFHGKEISGSGYYVIIEKGKYELSVYDAAGWLVTYPVVFGSNDLSDKMMEGDRRTPEGEFTVISKRADKKWNRFMMLNYPTPESFQKFNSRKEQGLIPQKARIGGGIGIHGVWPHEDFAVDRYDNWTQGCVSLKNRDVEELYRMIPVGTKIYIRK